jgi:hypothetical protein
VPVNPERYLGHDVDEVVLTLRQAGFTNVVIVDDDDAAGNPGTVTGLAPVGLVSTSTPITVRAIPKRAR